MQISGGVNSIPNATTTTPGAVTLAGDLGGDGTAFNTPRVGSLTGIAGAIPYSPNGRNLFSVSGNNLTVAENTWTSTSMLGITINIGNASTTGGVNIGNAAAGGIAQVLSSVSASIHAPFVNVGGAADLYPTTGRIRLPIANGIFTRSTTGVNVRMLEMDAFNRIFIGSTTAGGVGDIQIQCTGNFSTNTGGTTTFLINTSSATLRAPVVQFDESLASGTFGMQSKFSVAGAGAQLNITGQQALGAGNVGGNVHIRGGIGIVAANGKTRVLSDASLFVAEFGQASTTQRVASFCRTTATTTVQIPTGDLTVYIGNAATNPTLNPTSGFQLYSVAGAARPGFFGAAGMLSAVATAGAIAPPALVAGYWVLNLNGLGSVKIPYYNT